MKSTIVFAVILGVAAAGLVGGWHEMSANSNEAKKAGLIAELRVNEMSNDVFHKKTTRIISVRSKVVAGILYEVVLEVGSTGCPKGSDVSNCIVAEDARREICTMQFLEQPWLVHGSPTGKMVKAKCEPKQD